MSDAAAPGQALIVYGAGGQGHVVADAAEAAGLHMLGFLDDAPEAMDSQPDWPVLDHTDPRVSEAALHVAIGDAGARRRIGERLAAQGRSLATVVHPSAWVSPRARLGAGTYIGPQAVVHTNASVGAGCIINSGAIVEHHCRIGRYSHVAPAAAMGARCQLGESVLIGIGAQLLPGLSVGDEAIVGAGAVAVGNVHGGQTVLGAPAQPRRR